jgi:hypothetical protein
MSGLSHILLQTSESSLYEATIDFYKTIGFINVSKDNNQVILKLEAKAPAQDLTIKIKLVDGQAANEHQSEGLVIVIAMENLVVS